MKGGKRQQNCKYMLITSPFLCDWQARPHSVPRPNSGFSSQTSFHFFFLTKSTTTLFCEVETVSIFRKFNCQKSSDKHNWEVKNSWYHNNKYQITNSWNSFPSGAQSREVPLFAELAHRWLGFCGLCRMLNGEEKLEEGQIFVKCLLCIRHPARC